MFPCTLPGTIYHCLHRLPWSHIQFISGLFARTWSQWQNQIIRGRTLVGRGKSRITYWVLQTPKRCFPDNHEMSILQSFAQVVHNGKNIPTGYQVYFWHKRELLSHPILVCNNVGFCVQSANRAFHKEQCMNLSLNIIPCPCVFYYAVKLECVIMNDWLEVFYVTVSVST